MEINIRKIIGYTMCIAPFIAFVILGIFFVGLEQTIIVYLIVALFVLWVWAGLELSA